MDINEAADGGGGRVFDSPSSLQSFSASGGGSVQVF